MFLIHTVSLYVLYVLAFALLPLLHFCFVDDYLLAVLGQLLYIQNCFNQIHYLQKTLKSYKSIHGTYKYSTKKYISGKKKSVPEGGRGTRRGHGTRLERRVERGREGWHIAEIILIP